MPITTPPELTRSDISLYLLQLKALGIDNLAKFDFMSPPPSDMMIRALEFLYSLKAIDDEGRLTKPFGARMAEVPLDPMMAAIVRHSYLSFPDIRIQLTLPITVAQLSRV